MVFLHRAINIVPGVAAGHSSCSVEAGTISLLSRKCGKGMS
jgi:hypothetical protein